MELFDVLFLNVLLMNKYLYLYIHEEILISKILALSFQHMFHSMLILC